MKKPCVSICGGLLLAAVNTLAFGQAQPGQQASSSNRVPVTADNFTRAESDSYFANIVKQSGGLGRFFHRRKVEPVDNQIVIRANRDTLYSAAVFDLDPGPVTISLPDAGKRFMSLIVIEEDQYTPGGLLRRKPHFFKRPNRNALCDAGVAHAGRSFGSEGPPASAHVARCRSCWSGESR